MGHADEPVPDPQDYLKRQVNAAPTRKTPFVRYMTRSEGNALPASQTTLINERSF